MTNLKDFTGGEGFKSLEATIRFIGPPRKTSSGKVQDAMLVGEDGGTLGFAFWPDDMATQIGDGDTVELTEGWVAEGDYKPFKGQLIARIKKDGAIAVTGKEIGTPPPLPAQAQVMLTAATQGVVENGDRELRIVRQTALKVTGEFFAGNGSAKPEDLIDFARPLYRWAMGYGPHWIEDESTRKRFWAWAHDTMSLDDQQIHEALNVYSVKDFEGTKGDAMKLIQEYVNAK